jgi:hypothetical protein
VADQIKALKLALIRMLWRSTFDNAACTCSPRDVCPECEASKALGLGRYKSHEDCARKLLALGKELRRG